MVDLHVLPGENAEKYLWRIGQAKDSGELALGWNEISKLMNEKFIDDEIDYKGSSAWRKDYRTTKKFFDAGVFDNSDKDKELKDKKLELEKERKKLQTEKIEYNRWIREDMELERKIKKYRWDLNNFATQLSRDVRYGKDQFDIIFQEHEEYESLLREHNMTNGQTTIAMDIIRKYYKKLYFDGNNQN